MNPSVVSLNVVCLCAAWCGTCTEYEATFTALRMTVPGHRYRWIDIEDEADILGDVDIETFPTLMIAWQGRVLFAGSVLPRLSDALRLLAAQVERVSSWIEQGAVPAAGWHKVVPGMQIEQATAFGQLAASLA